jgi:hypothetical protein
MDDGVSIMAVQISCLLHPSFPTTLLHPAVFRLPHEQKMSSSMTELMPVLSDPVRRRRRYVLCLVISYTGIDNLPLVVP